MFLLFPGEWHNYKPDFATGWEEYWIGFEGGNIDNRIKNGFFFKQIPVFYVGLLEEIVQLYKQGIQVAKEQKSGYQQMLAGIVNHLLGLAFSLDKHSEFEDLQVANQINKAKIIFAENLQKKICVEELASELNMSYSWFRKLFKEYTGFAPAQYLQELRVLQAKELLTNTNLNTKEIAFQCGFESLQYFFTAFKNKTGYTPIKYKNFTQGKCVEL
jgi:AraC-like DNA-binding protein